MMGREDIGFGENLVCVKLLREYSEIVFLLLGQFYSVVG